MTADAARRPGRYASTLALVLASATHLWLVWNISIQALDSHVPPTAKRAPVWSLYFDSVSSPGPGADFFAVYHAGVQASRGESPYLHREIPRVTPYFFIYRYPSIVGSTLGRVLTLLPPARAYHLWTAVIESSLLGLLLVLWREPLPLKVKVSAIAILLLSTPYLLEVHMGQFTFVAAAATALAVLMVQRTPSSGRASLVAVPVLTAATLLKQFPAVAIAALLMNRRGRTVAIATAIATAAFLAPMAAAPATRHEFYQLNLVDDTTLLYPGNFGMAHLALATLSFLGVAMDPRAVASVSTAFGALVFTAITVAVWRSGSTDNRRTTGTLLAGFFLGYFRVWEHHYSAVIVAGVLVLTSLAPSGSNRATREQKLLLIALILLALPTIFALLPADPQRWTRGQYILLALPKVVGAVAVVLAGIVGPQGTARRSVSQEGSR